jgi:hypothetical protein
MPDWGDGTTGRQKYRALQVDAWVIQPVGKAGRPENRWVDERVELSGSPCAHHLRPAAETVLQFR